jgi:hypothetical protein
MATAQNPHTELNPLQISLLRLFNRPMSDEETLKLKRVLVEHYSGQLEEELIKVIADKAYQQKDFEAMLNGKK